MKMLRMGLIAALLAGLGSTAMASDRVGVYFTVDSGGYRHVDDRWRGGDRDGYRRDYGGQHWEGRDWDRRDWDRRHWEGRRDWDGRWGRPGWYGRGWGYVVPAHPYYGWHYYADRYCPGRW